MYIFKSYLRRELLNFPSLQRNYCNMVSDSMNNIAGVDMLAGAGTQGLQLSLLMLGVELVPNLSGYTYSNLEGYVE